MNGLQELMARLDAARPMAVETVQIEPPVWCHRCGAMLASSGRVDLITARIEALCADCLAATGRRERRQPSERGVRELVEVTRLLAWQAQDSADTYDDRGWHESARVLRELAEAANGAIEALRIHPQED